VNETEIKQAALKVAPKGKKSLKATTLVDTGWYKLLLQGPTGSGKTRTVAEALQTVNVAGQPTKVFVASTDIGGNGLSSVRDRLQAVGREDLLANVCYVDFDDYETFAAFTSGTLVPEVDGKPLWEWDPDLLVHDGFANFQESHIWRYVMDIAPIAKDSTEARDEGVQASLVEWGQIRRCSLLCIDQFNRLKNPLTGKTPSKITTVLLDDGKEDKFTHETKRGPLVIGAARSYMPAAFDYIVTLKAITRPGSKTPEYSYTCDVGGRAVAKQRGGEFRKLPEAAMKGADFKTLWQFLTQPPSEAEVK